LASAAVPALSKTPFSTTEAPSVEAMSVEVLSFEALSFEAPSTPLLASILCRGRRDACPSFG
jgi:hypothetical protein